MVETCGVETSETVTLMKSGLVRFGITTGMRGIFAVMYDDEGPIQSGVGSYSNAKEAWLEAAEWAEAENYPMEAEKCRRHADAYI